MPLKCVHHVSEQVFRISPVYTPSLLVLFQGSFCELLALAHDVKPPRNTKPYLLTVKDPGTKLRSKTIELC